jgi:hypothetical protein
MLCYMAVTEIHLKWTDVLTISLLVEPRVPIFLGDRTGRGWH